MNCKTGEFAFVIRKIRQASVGTVVKINSWTVIDGAGRWDVEAPRGVFFYAHDDDLCAMRGYQPKPGWRDELFDAHPIFSDGEPFLRQFRIPPKFGGEAA